jgi:hypothetical protein
MAKWKEKESYGKNQVIDLIRILNEEIRIAEETWSWNWKELGKFLTYVIRRTKRSFASTIKFRRERDKRNWRNNINWYNN